ncbi:MAG: acylphosphatase [Phycisphaerales bacterium]|nr:acylphosphatase [Phycisphaerales bacterium]
MIFTGRVQGVGFRATCVQISRAFAVVGWVRNLADGGVELHAQGASGEIAAFLKAIRSHFRGHIIGEQISDAAPGSEADFSVRA